MNDNEWDKLLKIKTTGRDDSSADTYRYPYEPTPYCVLERLVSEELINKKDTLIDYGCGKGRVSFFLSYQVKCKTIGIEYDERIYAKAMENEVSCVSGSKTQFECIEAQNYNVPENANRFYFFNPFSIELLHSVIGKITESYYNNPREMFLFFYYPSDEYIAYLMSVEQLSFYDEIDCRDLFEGNNQRERIIIFSF